MARNKRSSRVVPLELVVAPRAPAMPSMNRNQNRTVRRRRNRRRIRNAVANRMGGLVADRLTVPAAGGAIVRRGRQTPLLRTLGECTFVQNTEVLFTFTGGAGFSTSRFALIPGLGLWMDGVAVNFSKFAWRHLRFIYVPQTSTSSSGTIALSLGYDMDDAAPLSIVAAQQAYHSVSSPVWGGFDGVGTLHNYGPIMPGAVAMDVDVTRFGTESNYKYYPYITVAEFNAIPTLFQQNIYSPGYIDITAAGGSVSSTGGAVFVQYIIELIEPVNKLMNST